MRAAEEAANEIESDSPVESEDEEEVLRLKSKGKQVLVKKNKHGRNEHWVIESVRGLSPASEPEGMFFFFSFLLYI